jgi:hypothetical protein
VAFVATAGLGLRLLFRYLLRSTWVLAESVLISHLVLIFCGLAAVPSAHGVPVRVLWSR